MNNFYGHSPPSTDSRSVGVISENMCSKYWLTDKSSCTRKKVWLSEQTDSI